MLLALVWFVDSTMRSEADVLGAIDLPVLALLPYVATEQDRRSWIRRRWLEAAATAVLLVSVGALAWVLRLWRYLA